MSSVLIAFPSAAMPSSQSNLKRRNLTMDEQSFQSLLSAAFTIQEHNARRELELVTTDFDAERAIEPSAPEQGAPQQGVEEVAICQRCGAEKSSEESRCEACGLDDLRPGERMQRNWASMWLMSQEQRLWPERSNDSSLSASNFLAAPMAQQIAPEKDVASDAQEPQPTQNPAATIPSYPSVTKARATGPSEAMINADSEGGGLTGEKLSRKNKNIKDRGKSRPAANADSIPEMFPPSTPTREELTPSEFLTAQHEKSLNQEKIFNHDLVDESLSPDDLDHDGIGLETQIPHNRGKASLTIVESFPEEEARNITGVPLPVHVSNNVSSNISNSVPNDLVSSPGIRDLRLTDLNRPNISAMLRQHRADLYLGVAIFVAVLALLWPSTNSPKRSDLSLWDRTLIGMGIAEAPAPVAHLPGNPGVQVWIDPHTALYYCQGDDLYGKAANGRFSTQREAQMERFEPASRAACE